MRFLLRTTFWLGVVLVLLSSGSSQPVTKPQVSASEAIAAAEAVVADIQQFCERQHQTCVVASRTAITLGQRAQAGAKTLFQSLSERFGANDPKSVQSVPLPPERAQAARPLLPYRGHL